MHHDPETVRRLLERDLIEWADSEHLRLIWADLLQLEGDPIGRLVMLDHVGEGSSEAAKLARDEAEALRQQQRKRLWSTDISAQSGVTLHWRRGFVRELELRPGSLPLGDDAPPPGRRGRRGYTPSRVDRFEQWIATAMQQYALRWVEVVRIHIDDASAPTWACWVNGNVHGSTLREIHVGEPPQIRFRPSGTWELGETRGTQHGSDRTIANFPRLRWLSVAGELSRLPCRAGPSQTRVHFLERFAARPLSSPNRAALARALFDASVLVHGQAFAVAQQLGPQAEFLIDDLELFLQSPLSKKDPRPSQALRTLAAIGDASVVLLPTLLAEAAALTETHERRESVMVWLAALGPAAAPARPLVDAVLSPTAGELAKPLPKSLIDAAKRARKRIESV